MNRLLKGYALIVLSAVIYGAMPLMANYIYADGVNSITLVLLRNVFSIPVLFLIALLTRQNFAIVKRDLPYLATVGIVGLALTPLLLFSSYNYMGGGTATVLHFVYPAIVLLIEIVFLKAKPRLGSVAAIILCILGIALFYNPDEGISLTGSILALVSGAAYAVYIVLISRFGKGRLGIMSFSLYVSLFAAAVIFVVALVSGQLSFPQSWAGWLLSIFFALVINVGAVVLFQIGARIVGGQKASVLSTFEPIICLVVGYLALNESVGPLAIVGSVLILTASVLIAVQGKNE